MEENVVKIMVTLHLVTGAYYVTGVKIQSLVRGQDFFFYFLLQSVVL